jgi:hypothetical protein
MAKSKIVSLAMPPRILREVDRLARSDGRSRSSYVARALDRVIADSASSSSRGLKSMTDTNDDSDSRKNGTVVDRHLAKHGSPERTPPPYKLGKGAVEDIDHTLPFLPVRPREF